MELGKRLTISGCPGLIVQGVFWLLLAMILFGGYLSTQEQLAILAGSRTVPGTIIKTEEITNDEKRIEYYLIYEYDLGYNDPPDVRTGRQNVTQELYKHYPTGSAVTVHFQPDAREVSLILAVEELQLLFGLAVTCGIPFIIITLTLLTGVILRLRGSDTPKQKS